MKKIIFFILLMLLALFSCDDTKKDELIQSNKSDISYNLIDELSDYLCNINSEVDIIDNVFSRKLNSVKNGKDLLYVEFNSNDCYYVSGYLNVEHIEKNKYCCLKKYIWVKYENETEIENYYDNRKMIVCFQINKSSKVIDLKTNKVVDFVIEHYQIYEPVFENNKNVKKAIDFYEFDTIILKSKEKLYYCKQSVFYELYSLQTIKINGENYILIYKKTINEGYGYLYTADLEYDLGIYYDYVMSNIGVDEYILNDKNGNINYFLTLEIDKISQMI